MPLHTGLSLKTCGSISHDKQSFFISFLCLILLLCSVFQDPGELLVVKHTILDRGLPVHFVDLVISEPVPDGGEELPEPVLGDHADVLLVEAPEGVLDDLLGVGALESLPKEGEEHGEVDGSGGFVHHALEVVISGVLAERCKHVVEILLVDESVPVVVDHVESFLELLDLILVEHGEDIASGALSPLLGGATATSGFARRHFLKV